MSKLRSINTAIWNDVWFENLNSENKDIEFLKNELDALIDISQDNISDKKIEVDYTLKEEDTSTAMHGGNNFLPKSLKTNPSGATSTAGKAYQAAKGGIRGAYNIYKTLQCP